MIVLDRSASRAVGAARKKVKGLIRRLLCAPTTVTARGASGIVAHAQGLEVGDPIQFNSKPGMDRFFDDPTRVSDYLAPDRMAFYHMVANYIPCHAGERVLDIGCGPATLLNILQDQYEVAAIGIDQSETAGRWIRRKHPDIPFLVGDIYQLPFTHGSFDLIIATEVLEHLLYPARAIEAVLPLIRAGGRFFATVPDGRTDTFAGHINFWSYESLGVFAEHFGDSLVEKLPDGSLAMGVRR